MRAPVQLPRRYTMNEDKLAMTCLCKRCNIPAVSSRCVRNKICKICVKQYNSYTFGTFQYRRRDTLICWNCAKAQNLCRMCLVDREYGVVPEHLREFAKDVELERPSTPSPPPPPTPWEYLLSGGAIVIPRAGISGARSDAELSEGLN